MDSSETFLDNRHPEYKTYAPAWDFYQQSYVGGPTYRNKENLFKFPKEDLEDYQERLQRSVRTNHPKQIVDLLKSYLFKKEIIRPAQQEILKTFYEDVDRHGATMDKFMRDLAPQVMVNGVYYVMVDKPAAFALSYKDELDRKLTPYIYGIPPQNVLDIQFDDFGNTEWALILQTVREIPSPMEKRKTDGFVDYYWLWTKDTIHTFRLSDKKQVEKVNEMANLIGQVPLVQIRRDGSNTPYVAPSLIQEIAEMDRQVYNYMSLLDQILFDQTFSTLIMPFDVNTEDSYNKLKKAVGTKTILMYPVEAKNPPSYISPDASNAEVLQKTIAERIKQMYQLHSVLGDVGLEKTTSQQSGVSKAYDFDKLNSILAAEAQVLEEAERKIAKFVLLWMNQSEDLDRDSIQYPDEFDVSSLSDDLRELMLVEQAQVSELVLKKKKKQVAFKALPKLEEAEKKAIEAEIDASTSSQMDDQTLA